MTLQNSTGSSDIQNTTTLLVIEASVRNLNTFTATLKKKNYQVITVLNGSAAIKFLDERVATDEQVHLVIVNAHSMRTSGIKICHDIRKKAPGIPIILIIDAGITIPEKNDINVILELPFTTIKLINRIENLLPGKLVGEFLQAGEIRLDTGRHAIHFHNRIISVTPRMSTVLKILIQNVGEVVSREDLFMQAWNTDYTGDTRSLDTHISWLRQAIETNPKLPRYIKTMRGVGFRLDVEIDRNKTDSSF